MDNLFGLSVNILTIALLVIFGLSLLILTISSLRNRVMFKMAARNLPRRRANTVLTVAGLMLAAMIFSTSFSTGDTLTCSIRTIAADYLGETDIMVLKEGATPVGEAQSEVTEASVETAYFSSDYLNDVQAALKDNPEVEGIAPAIIESVPVIAGDLNEPAVSLLGLDPEYNEPFDSLIDKDGNELSLTDLGENEVYMSAEVAKGLDVDAGSNVDIYLGAEKTEVTVKAIYETGGTPSGELSMVTSLAWLKELRGSEDINYILITNQGDVISGAKHTDTVMEVLEGDELGLEAIGLKAEPVKQDVLDTADETGSMFTSMFLVFGAFSVIAGVLLIFLIFVMLAAERKRELGIARAVGAQRAHIIRLFTYEGVLYALIASAVGSALGIAFGRGMIEVMDMAFEEMGFDLTYNFTTNSLIISYTLGVILTLVVVIISAWLVGRQNIVRAIRDIPEPEGAGKRGIIWLIASIFLCLYGLYSLIFGLQEKILASYTIGASLLIIGLCLLARRLRLPDRVAFTLAGAALLIFWLMPSEWHPYNDEMTSDIFMFIWSGLFMVTGAILVVMFNSDLLLNTITFLFGRIKALAPILKTAVSYPMASRFRTGMALAMFALIVFTLIVMAVINASFNGILEDTDQLSGGFHIRSIVSNPTTDIKTALDEQDVVDPDDFQSISGFSMLPVEIRTPDTEQEWEDLFSPLIGVDDAYTSNTSYGFEMMTEDYSSEEEVWQALAEDPSLAVISTALVPMRDTAIMGGEMQNFRIEGDFYLEDEVLPRDVFIEVRNYTTEETKTLEVIGVLESMAVYAGPVTTSRETLDNLAGYSLPATSYWFKLKPEMVENAPEIATNLKKQFSANGMDTFVTAEEITGFMEMNTLFFNLMMVFMGLGLIVGIAALGVIATRSVVERRQQIGVLRALGFQRNMVQFSFLLESSFIALLGIGLGIALGLVLSIQLIPDTGVDGLNTVIPWGRIALIVGVAYTFSLLTTYLPALQASRVYPAEAIRFE